MHAEIWPLEIEDGTGGTQYILVSSLHYSESRVIKYMNKTSIVVFKNMIKEERNFSDEIVDYAKSTGLEKQDRIKGSAAKILRNYIADSYEKDLLN